MEEGNIKCIHPEHLNRQDRTRAASAIPQPAVKKFEGLLQIGDLKWEKGIFY